MWGDIDQPTACAGRDMPLPKIERCQGISTVFATNWYRFCDVHFCAFSAFFLAFCLHSVQRGAFSSCISQRIFVLLERTFAHFKALCCILSASTLLCLGVHLLCIHDAPFLDQCLMCILLHSCILYSMTFLRILTHSERLLRILGCMGGCSGEAPRHARPGMTAVIYVFFRVAFGAHSSASPVHLLCILV